MKNIISNKTLGVASVFVLIFGTIGHIVDSLPSWPPEGNFSDASRLVIYNFIKALKLFSVQLPDVGVQENWMLVTTRLVGALIAMAAVFKVIGAVFRQDVAAFFASFFRNHTVSLGFGSRNSRFLRAVSDSDSRCRVIVLDKDESKAKSAASNFGSIFFQSDLSIVGSMAKAGVEKAGLILIGTGSDERNLALARTVVKKRPRSLSPGRIVLTIDDAGLAEYCTVDPEIARPPNGDELLVFNAATVTARGLLQRTPFSDLALAASQPRVHLILAGFSETAQEIIVQFLRISPCRGLSRPRIDILARDRRKVLTQLFKRTPNLAYALDQASREADNNSPLTWAVDLRIHSADPASLCHDDALQAEVYAGQRPTAIVVALDDTVENVKIGLALKQMMRTVEQFQAPVYVHVPLRSSLESLLTAYDGSAPRPTIGQLAELRGTMVASEALEPFGALEDLCSLETLLGERERRARRLHAAYLERRNSEVSDSSTVEPSMQPWQTLDETYRQANRRSADHLPIKLLSIGAPDWFNSKPAPLAEAVENPLLLEEIARLEHESWRIDREMDGWRYAPLRDNQQRVHPDLIEYEALSERIKDYDRHMVRTIAASGP